MTEKQNATPAGGASVSSLVTGHLKHSKNINDLQSFDLAIKHLIENHAVRPKLAPKIAELAGLGGAS